MRNSLFINYIISNMEVKKTGGILITKRLNSKGDLKIDLEQNGTVRIEGYLYSSYGIPVHKQLRFLNEFVEEIILIVDQLNIGIPEAKDKKWFEFWKER